MFIANKILFHDALDWIHYDWNLLIFSFAANATKEKKKRPIEVDTYRSAQSTHTGPRGKRQQKSFLFCCQKNSRSKCTGIVHFYTFTRSSNHTKLLSFVEEFFLREKKKWHLMRPSTRRCGNLHQANILLNSLIKKEDWELPSNGFQLSPRPTVFGLKSSFPSF